MATDAEMGKYLARLRDKAGLKQNELAQKVTWSPAVLSRVESGERGVSTEELTSILEAIGTEEAQRFRKTAGRVWRISQKPQLGHPDEELLWEAEEALQNIEKLEAKPEIKNVFVKRLEAFRDELNSAAHLVLGTEHSVAFVGDIGVGKTTAICRVADLEVKKEKSFDSVLYTDGGGATVCDVHLIQGPKYGLAVEPMGENELYREVLEFAHFLKPSEEAIQEEDAGDPDFYGTSREIIRAIRNMGGLNRNIRKETRPNGKQVRVTVDPAKELAEKSIDSKALAVEILTRMALEKRTRRELWHSGASAEEPLLWLQKIFAQINNGRHSEFSIPKRIDITVPDHILEEELLSIRIVDTKGIDGTPERRDLEEHFNAPKTTVILCSSFFKLPSDSVRELIKRAKEGGFANLETKAAVVVLPHGNQALNLKGDEGILVETAEDAYEYKGAEIDRKLEELCIPDMRSEFFNSQKDKPERLRGFLLEMVTELRKRHRKNLREAIAGANDLVQNYEKNEVQEIQRQAASHLIAWRMDNKQIGPFSKHLHDSLLLTIRKAHANSLRASIRRQGEWDKLDYSHQLGSGGRAVAANAVRPTLENFKAVSDNLLRNPDLREAFSLVRQARHILESGTEDLLRKSHQFGTAMYGFMRYAQLWADCDREWGKGSGYRDRVSKHHQNWFADRRFPDRGKFDSTLFRLIEKEWQEILERLEAILDAKEDEE